MRSCLPPVAYTAPSWFEQEQARLFAPLWQFVAPMALLSVPDAFVVREVAGIPVVVQNMGGEICAFENVCLHRFAPLQCESHGVRPLLCRYHGWRYDGSGAVTNIPFEKQIWRLECEQRERLKLRRFGVHVFGGLVFVNVGDRPLAFDQQFSVADLESLREYSAAFDSEVLMTCFRTRMNWKLAYENLRDSLHPRYLHGSSLFKEVRFEPSIDEKFKAKLERLARTSPGNAEVDLFWLRHFSGGGRDQRVERPHRQVWYDYVDRQRDDEGWYLNWLLYPNLHIASANGGHSFIIEHHVPVTASRTDLHVYYVSARKKRPYAWSTAVLHAQMQGAQIVLGEDIEMMEQVQASLRAHTPRAVLGAYDYANASIERWYLDVMEGRRELGPV